MSIKLSTLLGSQAQSTAWVNFNGTAQTVGTTVSTYIRSQYNVATITKNATGDYTVNFATALTDANYAVSVSCSETGGTYLAIPYIFTQTASSCRIQIAEANSGTTFFDATTVCVIIYGT